MSKEKLKEPQDSNWVWEVFSRNYYGRWIDSRRSHDEAVAVANSLYRVWQTKNRQKISNGKKVKPFHAEIVKRNMKTGESYLVPYFSPEPKVRRFRQEEEEDPDWNPEWEKWV